MYVCIYVNVFVFLHVRMHVCAYLYASMRVCWGSYLVLLNWHVVSASRPC